MLEQAEGNTHLGKIQPRRYARFTDDLVILIDADRRQRWLLKAVGSACGRKWWRRGTRRESTSRQRCWTN